MKIRSNLLNNDEAIPVFWLLSYLLFHFYVFDGLVAASMVHLELILQQSPAFAILIVYYSIASWTLPLSSGFISENSSMQHTPQSASTRAPASKIHSFPSLNAATVRPAADVPIPVV